MSAQARRSSAVATIPPHAWRAGESLELYAETVHCCKPECELRYSVNNELTDSSFEMRVIVSASNWAQDSARIRLHPRASSDSGIVSVTTISSSSDSAMRATAPPESTGCVQYASTFCAPFSLRA